MLLGAIALMILAFALVAAELFVPSHGILAVIAFLVAAASVVLAYQVMPALGIAFTMLLLIATPVVFYWAIRIYPSTPMGQRVLLQQPNPAPAFQDAAARIEELLGKQGVALTLLRPAGSVEIEGNRIEALSESDMIASGTPVEVIRTSGLKVIVKPLPQ